MRRLLVLVALFFSLPTQAVTIDWVGVGNAGNAPNKCDSDTVDCGSVAYDYYISKYETTNAQYAEFLNAKAASDPLGLYNPDMGADGPFGGITQSGVSGSYTYAAKVGFENKPVVYVSFYDSLRFANWLNNGQGIGDTETGAYTLLGATPVPSNGLTVTRNAGAITFLPSDNEWYKAAYYDPTLPGYYDYPAGTDTQTTCATPGATPNTANCQSAVGTLTDVGSYTGSVSPYGTFDQGGNVREWNETIVQGSLPGLDSRGFWGGSWECIPDDLAGAYPVGYPPAAADDSFGFRVASLVPEPDAGLLGMTAVLGLAARRRRRAN